MQVAWAATGGLALTLALATLTFVIVKLRRRRRRRRGGVGIIGADGVWMEGGESGRKWEREGALEWSVLYACVRVC